MCLVCVSQILVRIQNRGICDLNPRRFAPVEVKSWCAIRLSSGTEDSRRQRECSATRTCCANALDIGTVLSLGASRPGAVDDCAHIKPARKNGLCGHLGFLTLYASRKQGRIIFLVLIAIDVENELGPSPVLGALNLKCPRGGGI